MDTYSVLVEGNFATRETAKKMKAIKNKEKNNRLEF